MDMDEGVNADIEFSVTDDNFQIVKDSNNPLVGHIRAAK